MRYRLKRKERKKERDNNDDDDDDGWKAFKSGTFFLSLGIKMAEQGAERGGAKWERTGRWCGAKFFFFLIENHVIYLFITICIYCSVSKRKKLYKLTTFSIFSIFFFPFSSFSLKTFLLTKMYDKKIKNLFHQTFFKKEGGGGRLVRQGDDLLTITG